MVADIENDRPDSAYAEVVGALQPERMQGVWLSSQFWRRMPDPPRVRAIRAWVAANKRLVPMFAMLGLARSQPLGPWQKGWSWWSLPQPIAAEACAFISDMLRSGRLRATVCSDEHVVPTLLANRFIARIRPYRRFIAWQEKHSHPEVLSANDLPAIAQSGAWFARKVDVDADDFFLTSFPEFVADPAALIKKLAA